LLLPREDGKPGSPPHRILCLTYTKAAASEMALRISRTLSRWATKDDAWLANALHDLLGRPANDAETGAARRLFASVVDAPGGLKIMTIHSFCQSVLGRFPLEAKLAPHFTTLEDSEASALLTRARDAVLSTAQQQPDTPEGQALVRLAAEQTEEQFSALLKTITAERHQLGDILRKLETGEGFYAALCAALGIDPRDTAESVYSAVCADENLDIDAMWQACAHLASGSKTDQERGLRMQFWLEKNAADRAAAFEEWKLAFLTKAGEPRKALMTKALLLARPDLDEAMRMEADRLVATIEHLNACKSARLTHDLVILGRAIAEAYQTL
jgi:ATP-dependent helicase/nuclease subunit A